MTVTTANSRPPGATVNFFNISLHRSATQSSHDLFRRSGIAAIHWPAEVSGIDYQAKVEGHEDDPGFVARTLKPVFSAYRSVSDAPMAALYRPLSADYPNARFFAFYRPASAWIRSVRTHIQSRPFVAFERAVYWSYFLQRPQVITDIADCELSDFHAWHHDSITTYFANNDNFLLLSLECTGLGPALCNFCGIPPVPLRIVDYAKGHDLGLDPASIDAEVCA
nr:sulfotransferase [uncultured Rhodopila sp.]